MEKRGWNLTDLSHESGRSVSTVWRVATGHIAHAQHQTRIDIAAALNMPVQDLFPYHTNAKPKPRKRKGDN